MEGGISGLSGGVLSTQTPSWAFFPGWTLPMLYAGLVQTYVGHCSAHDGWLDFLPLRQQLLCFFYFPKWGWVSLESCLWGARLALTLLLGCVLAHTYLPSRSTSLGCWGSCLGGLAEPGAAGSEVLRALEMHSAGDSLPSELTWGSGYPAPQQEDRRALARPQERH